jgi:SH3-like domain-containing protein
VKWLLFLLSWQVFAADPVCTKTAATLRKGPGNQHAVSWRVPRFMPFMRFERKSGWVRVEDLDGESHWAKSSDLTTQFRCVVVKANIATLRKEPSSSSPPQDLKTLDKYTPLKRLGSDREWMQVEDETGRTAWIHESLVWKPVNVQSISF